MENANGDDWREELYLKIRSIKELCLPHVSDLYQTAVDKLHHQESLPPQQRSEFEKLKQFKKTLERMIQFLSVPKSKIMPALKHRVAYYEKQIMDLLMMHGPRQLPQSQTIHGQSHYDNRTIISAQRTPQSSLINFQNNIFILSSPGGSGMQQNASSSKPGSSLEPGQGSGLNNGTGGDWQEQVFQKIQTMKEMYLPQLNEIYLRVAIKVHQHDSIPQQQRSDEFEKLTQLKTMLERMMQFLSVPKTNILPALKDKLDYYEKQIIGFLNMHRLRDTVQQPQMQQPQSQTIQDQSHDNQTNPQMKSMSMQVSGPRAQESSLTYMQNNVPSSLPRVSAPQQNIPSFIPASSLESGQGNALNYGQQVFAMGSMLHNTSQQVNNGSASAQSGLWTLHSNVNQSQLSSILLQHQQQQQQDQLMQLKRQFQYRQMQQQELLQLLQQQQMPQQMTQQLKQQFQYLQMQQQQLQQQVIQLQHQLQAKQQDQQMRQQLKQQFQQHQMQQQQQNIYSFTPASNLESGQGNALKITNGSDWQEEVFQKINSMKERYLADLNELYQRVVAAVQQDSLPPQERSDKFEKQKEFKRVLEHVIRFLSVSKSNIFPASKDKLDYIETQIIRYLDAHRRPEQGN